MDAQTYSGDDDADMTTTDPERDARARELELLQRLEGIYASGGLLTPADQAALVVAAELESVSADAAFVATLSEDGARIEVSRVTAASVAPARLAFPINASYPLAEVLRGQTALVIASNEELACDHPGLVRVDAADHACATIPLRGTEGRLLGAMNLGFANPRAFSESDRAAIQALGRRCAAALQAAQS